VTGVAADRLRQQHLQQALALQIEVAERRRRGVAEGHEFGLISNKKSAKSELASMG
jgi:hypothetical protein